MNTNTSRSACNVYVASLPMNFSDQQLFELFAPYGSICSARIMRAKGTRHSKGYGFVLFKEPSAAILAVSSIQGAVVKGCQIQVRLAHPDASSSLRKFAKRESSPSSSEQSTVSLSPLLLPSNGSMTLLPAAQMPYNPTFFTPMNNLADAPFPISAEALPAMMMTPQQNLCFFMLPSSAQPAVYSL